LCGCARVERRRLGRGDDVSLKVLVVSGSVQ
jgi:hypothetical protein